MGVDATTGRSRNAGGFVKVLRESFV
jgi:hypothetical protein